MMNKKGFSLMELLVALFISAMVTVALVSVWRSASMQTGQGQRQAIVRNNLSIFLRSVYSDITEADLVLYPSTILTGNSSDLLVVFFNTVRNADKITAGRESLGSSYYHYYCLNSDNIVRISDTFTGTKTISDFLNNLSCSGGAKVMNNVNGATVTTERNAAFNAIFHIYKDFGANSVPVNIEFDETFVTAGGA